jgi:hypothetical protein
MVAVLRTCTDAHLEPARMLMPQQQHSVRNTSSSATNTTGGPITALLSLSAPHRRAMLAFLEAASPGTKPVQ